MAQEFVNLENLIPGEWYSFTTQLFPNVRIQGIFYREVVVNHVEDTQYFFSNVLTPHEVKGIINFANPYSYPRNIIHLSRDGAPPILPPQPLDPDYGALPPQPPSRGGKSRKTKKRRNRKSKRR